jgi:VWFA-related protein
MRMKHVVGAVLLYLVSASAALAQSAPPPPPPALPTPSAQSAVHVTTRIVQVSVTVHDDRGRPVTGLTKDDFVLLDQGQRQQIASIAEQTNRLAATAAAPDLFTNRFDKGVSQPPLTVIVLDAFNAGFFDHQMTLAHKCPQFCNMVGAIFHQVEKFIGQMQPQDRVALYELTDKLYLLQDFTSDSSALQRGIDRGKSFIMVSFPPSRLDPIDMGAHTLDAMHTIADRLAGLPGRKNLIWLSTGFPPARTITDEMMDKTAKTLGNADLPLAAMDAKGLAAPPGQLMGHASVESSFDADIPTPAFFDGGYGPGSTNGRTPAPHDFDYSKNLSEMSGGRAFYDTNDLAGAIRKVIDDSASTYILNYYPDHNKWNGQFREIKVKVDRPGLEVRARRGYFAVADTASAAEHDAQKLADAIRSPLESTDLGIDVQAHAIDVSGVRQLKVKITLDANQLRFQQQGDKRTDSLSETWAEFNAEGKQVGEISKTIDLNRSENDYKQLLRDGYTFSKTLVLAKDAAEVRLILRDAGNGAIGSVIIPLFKLFAPPSTTTQQEKPE